METAADASETTNSVTGSESPSSKCPICLSQIENPAYTDKCFHQFCFTCLLEWSKVNAVCPLCKQGFHTIVYDVQSYEKFKEMPVKVEETLLPVAGFSISGIINHRTRQSHHSLFGDARFRYRTTMSWPFRQMMHRLEEQRLTELLRLPSLRISSGREFVFSDETRRVVYRTGLQVQHLETRDEQVFSCITPRFFRENPACKIRLSQWLQRELRVLLHFNNRYDIDSAICVIMNLLDTSRLASQHFCTQLQPYFGHHTYHFLQELYCFARSAPYTMSGYDSVVVYGEGTNGAIWSEWHRIESRTESSVALDRETGPGDSRLPLDRLPMSFQIVRRTFNRPSVSNSSVMLNVSNDRRLDSPVPTISRMSSQLSVNVVDVSDEEVSAEEFMVLSNESDEEVEVIGQDPPWNSRSPIVISDESEHEIRCQEEHDRRSKEDDLSEVRSRLEHRITKRNKSSNDSSEFHEASSGRDHSVDQNQKSYSRHHHQKYKRHRKNRSDEHRKELDTSSSEECHRRSKRHCTRSLPRLYLQERRLVEKCYCNGRHYSDSQTKTHGNYCCSLREYSSSEFFYRDCCAEGQKGRCTTHACKFLDRDQRSSHREHSKYSGKLKRRHRRHRRRHEENSSDYEQTRHSAKKPKVRREESSQERNNHEELRNTHDSEQRMEKDCEEQEMTSGDLRRKENETQSHNLASTSHDTRQNADLEIDAENQQHRDDPRVKNYSKFWSDSETDDEISSKGLKSVIGFSSYSSTAANSVTADPVSENSLDQNLFAAFKNDNTKRKAANELSNNDESKRKNSRKVCKDVIASEDEFTDSCSRSSMNERWCLRNQDETFERMKADETCDLQKNEENGFNLDSQDDIVSAIFCDSVSSSSGITFKKHSAGHKNSLFKPKNIDQICRVIENYSKNSS